MAKSHLKSSSAGGTSVDDDEEYDSEEEMEEDDEESEEEGETTVVDDDMSGTDATKSLLAKTLIETLPSQVFSDVNKEGPATTSSEIAAQTKEELEQEQIFMEAIRRKLAE